MALQRGSSGPAVTALQQALLARGYSVGPTGADGVFGSNTDSAVRAFQRAAGLSVDGIAGPQTLGALAGAAVGGGAQEELGWTASGTPAPGTAPSSGLSSTTKLILAAVGVGVVMWMLSGPTQAKE